eukprot:gene29701-5135_t
MPTPSHINSPPEVLYLQNLNVVYPAFQFTCLYLQNLNSVYPAFQFTCLYLQNLNSVYPAFQFTCLYLQNLNLVYPAFRFTCVSDFSQPGPPNYLVSAANLFPEDAVIFMDRFQNSGAAAVAISSVGGLQCGVAYTGDSNMCPSSVSRITFWNGTNLPMPDGCDLQISVLSGILAVYGAPSSQPACYFPSQFSTQVSLFFTTNSEANGFAGQLNSIMNQYVSWAKIPALSTISSVSPIPALSTISSVSTVGASTFNCSLQVPNLCPSNSPKLPPAPYAPQHPNGVPKPPPVHSPSAPVHQSPNSPGVMRSPSPPPLTGSSPPPPPPPLVRSVTEAYVVSILCPSMRAGIQALFSDMGFTTDKDWMFMSGCTVSNAGPPRGYFYKFLLTMTDEAANRLYAYLGTPATFAQFVGDSYILCTSQVRLSVMGSVIVAQDAPRAYALDPGNTSSTCWKQIDISHPVSRTGRKLQSDCGDKLRG